MESIIGRMSVGQMPVCAIVLSVKAVLLISPINCTNRIGIRDELNQTLQLIKLLDHVQNLQV